MQYCDVHKKFEAKKKASASKKKSAGATAASVASSTASSSAQKKRVVKTCIEIGCSNKGVRKGGYCTKHYNAVSSSSLSSDDGESIENGNGGVGGDEQVAYSNGYCVSSPYASSPYVFDNHPGTTSVTGSVGVGGGFWQGHPDANADSVSHHPHQTYRMYETQVSNISSNDEEGTYATSSTASTFAGELPYNVSPIVHRPPNNSFTSSYAVGGGEQGFSNQAVNGGEVSMENHQDQDNGGFNFLSDYYEDMYEQLS